MNKILLALHQLFSNAVDAQVLANLGVLKTIKAVYLGDPIQIPEVNIPAITIQPINSDYDLRGSQYDQKTHTIEIRIVVNRKEFYNDTGSPNREVEVIRRVTEQMESVGDYQNTEHESIAGLIQSVAGCLNYDNGSELIRVSTLAKITSIQYTFSGDRGFPTYEAIARTEAIGVGNR